MTMFHTLESATFEQVNENKKKSATPHFSQVKFTRFCGARARSVSGCLTCRKRKKKCDEVHPKCGNCKHRGEVCEWPVKGERKSTKLRGISSSESSQMHENTNLFAKINQNSKNADVGFATPPSPQKSAPALPSTTSMSVSSREKMKIDFLDNAPDDMRANEVVQELEGFKEDLANFQLALEQSRSSTAGNGSVELYDEDGTEDVYIPTEFLAGFGFPYFSNLDKDGMVFLECYREQYSTFVSIGTETSNYFLKTFLSIAASNEGITYALTAWGGFFLELRKPRSDFTKPWEYMQKATRCMCSQMGDYLRPNDKNQFYELFAFYLIFIGIEVCTGDVRNWRGFMTQCSLLIQSYGGILKVLDLFGYSNDIKWLISDFKFHDLLSSKCLIDGPIFLVEDYVKALEPRPEYGIDPLQGIVGPLYDIIGRIGTAKADLARKWVQVKYNVQAQNSDAEQITASYYDMAQQMIDNLKAQIASCKPSAVHMDLLADDEEDRKLHLALFELHVHICRLQLATSLERMPPNTITQQYSLHKALPLIDYLQATKLKVSLSLSLLVCGMTCCAPHDRASMTRRFRSHSNQYEIGNLQRIEETVVGAWECNPTGAVCIDWAEFVRDKEWHLYVG